MSYTPKSKNAILAYSIFLVWPFFSFIFAMLNWRRSYAKIIFILFSGFLGYCFFINGADCSYYQKIFISYHENLNAGPIEFFQRASRGELGRGDYYDITLTYITSRFSGDHRVLFGCFGLIFGYFYAQNIWLLMDFVKKNISYTSGFLILLLLFINPFWAISAVRYYTALHIFIYGVIMFEKTNSKKYWLLIGVCYFIHVSYGLAILIYCLYFVLRAFPRFCILVLLIGIALSSTSVEQLLGLIPSSLPLIASDRLSGYTHETMVESMANSRKVLNWYMVYRMDLINFLTIVQAFILYFNNNKPQISRIYIYGVLIIAFSLIFDAIPALDRFYSVGHFLILFAFIVWLNSLIKIPLSVRLITPLIIFVSILYFLVELRIGIYNISINTFLLNPLIAPFFKEVPLSEFLF